MSDTLRAELDRVAAFMHYAGNHKEGDTVDKAIAELDRLEAEVKKPRLPKGLAKVLRFLHGSDALDGCHFGDDREDKPKYWWRIHLNEFADAFLPTPDVVPSTETVQADKTKWKVTRHGDIYTIKSIGGPRSLLTTVNAAEIDAHHEAFLASHLEPGGDTAPEGWGDADADSVSAPTAKPKPVSLVAEYERWNGAPLSDLERRSGMNLPCGAFAWLLRTLDQARGV